jgi:hypothetical protein
MQRNEIRELYELSKDMKYLVKNIETKNDWTNLYAVVNTLDWSSIDVRFEKGIFYIDKWFDWIDPMKVDTYWYDNWVWTAKAFYNLVKKYIEERNK